MSKRSQKRARAARNQDGRAGGAPTRKASDGVSGGVVVTEPSQSSPTSSTVPPTRETGPPPSGVREIRSAAEATALAHRLREEELHWPVVVVTTAAGQDAPYVPAEELAREVDRLAEVVVMPTGAASWAFSEGLPPMTQVYGGASRVYAPDKAWLRDPYTSPLRFAWNRGDGSRVKDLLVSDAARTAFAARTVATPLRTRQVSGEVLGDAGSRGLVRLDDGATVAIWPELTVAGVPIERLVRRGQRVEGELDADTNRLDVRGMLDLVEDPGPGGDLVHVLVRVAEVSSDAVVVELLPGRSVRVSAELAADDPRVAFETGEVVVGTWFVENDDAVVLHLDLWDGEEQVSPAPAILPGGPPWLEVPRVGARDDGAAAGADTASTASPPGEDPSADGDGVVDLDNPLAPELMALRRASAEQSRENERLREEIRELRRAGRQARGRRNRSERERPGVEGAFLDAEEQLRFEVRLEWATRIAAAEKEERRLRKYHVGPRFLDSLRTLEGVRREKVVQVIVEVLTGLATELDGRDLHQLRINEGGGSPKRVREDGATCWRAALQRETASARRLHYWERPDGTVELSRVVKHDDTEP